MQGGPLDVGAPHEDGLEDGERRGPARAAHGDLDVVQVGGALLGRELVGDGPPGRPGGEAELLPPGQVRHLDDHAVDLVGEVVAVVLPAPAVLDHLLDGVEHPGLGVHREPQLAQEPEGVLVAGHGWATHDLAELVAPHRQLALGRDRGVLLAERAGRGVAGVDERRLARSGGPLVEGVEGGRGHVHLAPHFEDLGGAGGQGLGDDVDGADVCRDVLPHLPVTTGGGLHQLALLVTQRDRHPIDLQFTDVLKGGRLRRAARPALKAVVPGPQVVLVEGVVERQQRRGVDDGGEQLGPSAAHPMRG